MSNSTPSTGDIFDVRRIRRLVELMNEHELGEIDLRDGALRIRLRKHQQGVLTAIEPRMPMAAAAQAPSRPAAPTGAEPAKSEEHIKLIKSPMVGTFFVSPSPESPPFVKVGDHVGPESPVCIIEAMKVFNEIPAEVAGQIVAVLVENGAPVEFGQPLFKVDTRQ
jgi:acetyl-CoA carboxylase biotin carboxyl carrier protein